MSNKAPLGGALKKQHQEAKVKEVPGNSLQRRGDKVQDRKRLKSIPRLSESFPRATDLLHQRVSNSKQALQRAPLSRR